MRIIDADQAIKFFQSMSALSVVNGDYDRSKMYQAAVYAIDQLADAKNNIGKQTIYKLLGWITQCGFGYDELDDLYWKYQDKLKDMDYVQGLLYIAQQEVRNENT